MKRPRKRRILDGTRLIFGVGLGLFGLYLLAVGVVRPLLQVYEARDWKRNTCRVDRADVSRHVDSDDNVSFRMKLRYSFGHAGHRYWGTRLGFVGARSESTEGALRQRFPAVGARVPCWFDPSDPRRSVLRRDGWAGWAVAAPLILIVIALGLSAGAVRRTPGQRVLRDGRLQIKRRNGSVLLGAVLAWFAFLFGPGGAVLLASGAGAGVLLLLIGLAASIWLTYVVLGLLTVVSIVIDKSEVRAGQPVGVSWTARAPFRSIEPTATLVGREQCTWNEGSNPKIALSIFHQQDLSPDSALDIPRHVPPTIAEGNNRIEWLIQAYAPVRGWRDLEIEIPLVVRGALPSGDTAAASIAPRPRPSRQPLSIQLDDDRVTFEPGQTIAGTIAWNLERAPRRATLSLTWTSKSDYSTHDERAGTVDIGTLPRLVETDSADPYRGAPVHEEASAPLAARDRRRLRIVAPDAPYTYAGDLFRVQWKLELKLEPDRLADPVTVDLVIAGRGPDREPPPPARRSPRKQSKRHRR